VTEEILKTYGLTKDFGGVRAVNNLNFTLEKGELRCVIGPNGAGKTTFFDLVTGFVRPTKGRIFFKGKDITGKHPHEISRLGIGRKFQITSIYTELTTRENLIIPVQLAVHGKPFLFKRVSEAVNEKVDEILEMIELKSKSDEKASSLSYFEKQRLELGMVLASDPELLLLDEPTAGMSVEETRKTAELIKKIAKNRSVIIIEHDIQFVKQMGTKISVMHYGSILAEGSFEDILADKKVVEAYFGTAR
jgi:urea transport system ATP-binding protein